MLTETTEWYPSKVDWWIALLLCVPPVATVGTCLLLLLNGSTSELPAGLGSLLLVTGIYLGLVFPMRYGVDETHLIVRNGLCRNRIPLTDISEVRPTHNPLSSPALSLDRLRVQFGDGFGKAVMISPAEKDRFLDDLGRRTGLNREGDRLVRS